mmetsp:Transcript_15697/g.29591  ORF Transcript_15697/g.29591 Transcript_15697/m.29591 type:complete len:297 (+) Transcript_15697:244-1134(+)
MASSTFGFRLKLRGRFCKVGIAVGRQHVVAGCLQSWQGIACSTRKDHQRDLRVSLLQRLRDAFHRRHRELFQVRWADVLTHRLKDLQHLASGSDLGREILDDDLAEQIEQLPRRLRVLSKPPLPSVGPPLRGAANHVEEERPRCRAEANQRRVTEALFFHGGNNEAHGLQNMGQPIFHEGRRGRVGGQALQVGRRLQGLGDEDSFAPRHLDVYAKRFCNHQNVRKQDGCVDAISPQRLHGALRHVLRVLQQLQEVFAALRLVFIVLGQMPPCLPEQPNRHLWVSDRCQSFGDLAQR